MCIRDRVVAVAVAAAVVAAAAVEVAGKLYISCDVR